MEDANEDYDSMTTSAEKSTLGNNNNNNNNRKTTVYRNMRELYDTVYGPVSPIPMITNVICTPYQFQDINYIDDSSSDSMDSASVGTLDQAVLLASDEDLEDDINQSETYSIRKALNSVAPPAEKKRRYTFRRTSALQNPQIA